MTYLRYPRVLLPLLLLALLAVAPVPATAQSKGDVSNAKAAEEKAFDALREADARLEEGLEEMEKIEGQIYSLSWRITKLGDAIVEYGDNVTALQGRARSLVLEAYTSGGRNLVTSAFTAESIQDLITTQALYDEATTRDLNQLDQLAAVSRQMDRLTDELTVKEAEVELLRAEHQLVVERLEADRGEATKAHADAEAKYAETYKKYKAELARQAVAAAARKSGGAAGIGGQTRGVACPVGGHSYFINSWGYPRSGGRTHKGTDMMAAYGTPLVAMNSGTVRVNSHYQGGRQVYVNGDDGVTYYYAHMSRWANGLSTGQRVNKGQTIGFVGDSGNARGTPHLHLGMIAGGIYVNPYPTVRAAC